MSRCPRVPSVCAVTILLLAGCARPPAIHYYVLEPPKSPSAVAGPSGVRVGVDSFEIAAPYDQDRIVYRVGEGSPQVGFYAYHRWAAPLARMLPQFVAGCLDETPGLAAIEPAAPGADYDARLRGRLLLLEELDLPEGQSVRVRLELTLERPDGSRWTDRVEGTSSVRTNDVEDVVEAMRETLAQALLAARARLQPHLTQVPRGGD